MAGLIPSLFAAPCIGSRIAQGLRLQASLISFTRAESSSEQWLGHHRSRALSCRRFSALPSHTVINMPALSPTMSQGNLAKWHVRVGDEVKPGTVLADIETDKAILAFENQDEGFIAKLLVPDGARDVPVGKPVAVLVDDSESVGAFADFSPGGSPAPPPAAPKPAAPAPPTRPSAPAAAAAARPAPATTYPPHTTMTMPSLSPTMDRGNIVSWKVGPGDALRPGDELAEIETDKATLAFENVSDEGFVAKILVPAGSRDVPVGTPLALVVEEASLVPAFENYGGAHPAVATAPPPPPPPPQPAAAAAAHRVVASDRLGPAARLLLEAAGLSPRDVTPSGPHHIITKADVLAAIAAGGRQGAPPPAAAAQPAPAFASLPPAVSPAPAPAAPSAATAAAPPSPRAAPPPPASSPSASSSHDTPHSQIRRVIARRLLQSKLETPALYLTAEARLGGLADLRAALAGRGVKVSVNDCVLRAVALALRDVPAANVFWDEAAGGVRRFPSVDVSVAVATERGLITPIVRGADAKALLTISQEVRSLALRARENKLKPEEFTGGSFTVSNLGMYGLSYFSAIINPPQAGILAVGGAQERVVLRGGTGEPAEERVMAVTLSADSRVYDGELAGALLDAFRNHIERPYELVGGSSS